MDWSGMDDMGRGIWMMRGGRRVREVEGGVKRGWGYLGGVWVRR